MTAPGQKESFDALNPMTGLVVSPWAVFAENAFAIKATIVKNLVLA